MPNAIRRHPVIGLCQQQLHLDDQTGVCLLITGAFVTEIFCTGDELA